MINGKSLEKGAESLKNIVVSLGGVFLTLMVLLLVIGVLAYQGGTNGTLDVSNATKTNIDGLETTFDTQVVDNTTSASGTVAGLVVLVIILGLFAFIWASRGSRKGGIN